MADLLTISDRTEIRAAIQDVFDTYMKEPAILRVRNQGVTLTAFNEDLDTHKTPIDFEINVLYVPVHTESDGEAQTRKEGYYDGSESIVYIPVSDLKNTTPPLWDDLTGIDIVPNRDNLIIKGESLTIKAANPVAPDESSFFMVKIVCFKEMESKGAGEN